MKIKLPKNLILNAAIQVLQSGQSLNARAIAKQLNCSTQPIYSVFKDMEQLKLELIDEIIKVQKKHVEYYLNQKNYQPYKAYGMGFVKFAQDETNLFKFLYMQQPTSLFVVNHDYLQNEILIEMQKSFNLSIKQAQIFHQDMSIYTYGLAVMQTGGVHLSEQEISNALYREFLALKALNFKKE